jgi:hypothetical protein
LLSIAAMVIVIVGAATRGDTVFLAFAIAILLLGVGRLVYLMRRAA